MSGPRFHASPKNSDLTTLIRKLRELKEAHNLVAEKILLIEQQVLKDEFAPLNTKLAADMAALESQITLLTDQLMQLKQEAGYPGVDKNSPSFIDSPNSPGMSK